MCGQSKIQDTGPTLSQGGKTFASRRMSDRDRAMMLRECFDTGPRILLARRSRFYLPRLLGMLSDLGWSQQVS